MLLQIGEIAKYYTQSADGDIRDEEYFYVFNRVMHDRTVTSYLLIPIHVFKTDQADNNSKQELELLQNKRTGVSERFKGSHPHNYYRAEYALEMREASHGKKVVSIDRITDGQIHSTLQEKAIQGFIHQNHIRVMAGASDVMYAVFDRIAQKRKQETQKDKGNFLDIDLISSAAVGIIPQEVADILITHGKINRLGTALKILSDPDKGKLYQIYAKASPAPTLTYSEFRLAIRQGMGKLQSSLQEDPEGFQARLPENTILQYSGLEKISFRFKKGVEIPKEVLERKPESQEASKQFADITIKDAQEAGYFLHLDTFTLLQDAGIKTLRDAWCAASSEKSKILIKTFKTAAVFLPLESIKDDIIEAFLAFEENVKKPDEYEEFDTGVIIYREQEFTYT
jgi:hypothetical protein